MYKLHTGAKIGHTLKNFTRSVEFKSPRETSELELNLLRVARRDVVEGGGEL